MGGAGGDAGPLVAGGLCDPTRLPVDDVHWQAVAAEGVPPVGCFSSMGAAGKGEARNGEGGSGRSRRM